MNCWEILALEPTSDKDKIKKAYEAKLNRINVDEEPVASQKLKEAFDSALFLSGTIIESNRPKEYEVSSFETSDFTTIESTEEVPLSFNDLEKTKDIEATADILPSVKEMDEVDYKVNGPEQNEKEQSTVNISERFKKELDMIYEKMEFFSDFEKWTPLFSNELEWSSEDYNEISSVMQNFLLVNYRVLSREVICYLSSFFDFDSLARDHKAGDYFCYTWMQIKHVPMFSFDIYQIIPKEQRLEYFTNRYELFQIFTNGIPDQSIWQERFELCKAVTTQDVDVVNLHIAYVLMNDFRLEDEQTTRTFKELIQKSRALKVSTTCEFFSTYYEWAKNHGAANDVLIFDKSEAAIPDTTVQLLMGYVYFHLRRRSRVKECWAELAKKNPSLFRPKELAMLQSADALSIPQNKQKKKKLSLWSIVLIIICILKLANATSNIAKRHSYTPASDSPSLISGENNSVGNPYTAELTDLKESNNVYDQFIYYFYIDREDEQRANFVEEKLVGQAKEKAQRMILSELPEIVIDSRSDFYPSPDNVAGYGFVTALTLLDEDIPFVILQEDDEEKISNVFGEGWEVLPQDKLEALWADIQVRPMMSQKFFVSYYLLSAERKENLRDNPEYTTENVKAMLEKNSSMPIAEELKSGTWQISQDEEDKLYTIINDGNHEHCYILSFDDYGRLEHIYGKDWEKIDEEKRKIIYENAEEEVDVF